MVFFIDATTATTLEDGYAAIAQAKGVGTVAKDAVPWLSTSPDTSFVLIDNADDANIDIRKYIPQSLNSHVLITTRLHHAGRHYASDQHSFIELEALHEDQAERLLTQTAGLSQNRHDGVKTLVQVRSFLMGLRFSSHPCWPHRNCTATPLPSSRQAPVSLPFILLSRSTLSSTDAFVPP